MSTLPILLNNIEAFDFDGVMTNNLVYLDQNGLELVCCSRVDGLEFDALRKLKKKAYILNRKKFSGNSESQEITN